MRIIAGERKGTRLVAPKGDATRPTLGRVRESLFMILHERFEGARVLDLFAGAGGLALEALSRGAASAVAVDSSRAAISALRTNAAKLDYLGRGEIIESDVFRWLGGVRRDMEPFDLIFLDPPYGADLAARALTQIGAEPGVWLSPGGIVIAQTGRRDLLAPAYRGLHSSFTRTYGETRIEFFTPGGQA